MFLQNQNSPGKKFPTNAEIGKALQPDDPLGTDAVRSILDMMRDDLGMPVDFIEERGGHGFTESVAGFPLDAISEEQAYYLIQSVQMLGVHRHAKLFAEIRAAVKRACLGICFALNIDFEDIEEALSFHVVGVRCAGAGGPGAVQAGDAGDSAKAGGDAGASEREAARRGEAEDRGAAPSRDDQSRALPVAF
jgi:hypothetical protein